LSSKPNGGAVIIPDGTGYIPGLGGRLNPILDSLGRTYIYAENIAINGGATQPVEFTINRPFRVRDSHRQDFELEVVAIKARSSLIEYSRLGTDGGAIADKGQDSRKRSVPSQRLAPSGPAESSTMTDSVTVLRIPGPSSGSRVVRFETNGDSNQKISVRIQPQKMLFEPPGSVVERKDLPVELNIGGHRITIVSFTDEGFVINSHGVARISMGAYVLEGIPSGSASEVPAMPTPSTDVHEQLVGGTLVQGWTLHKHGEALTLYCIIATDQLTPVVKGTIEQSDFDIGPELSTKANALWAEIRRNVPPPKLVETEYGTVTGQEVVEHVTHQFGSIHAATVQWTYEILRNGTGITPEPQVFKDIDIGKLSQNSRDTIEELDNLAVRTVNRRYIDTLVRLSK
jgi:hypothetical protein